MNTSTTSLAAEYAASVASTYRRSVAGRVTRVVRHGCTVYGNPIMSVQLDGGEIYRISDNAGIVYAIGNLEYRDVVHVFELTRAGRISGRATRCDDLATWCESQQAAEVTL